MEPIDEKITHCLITFTTWAFQAALIVGSYAGLLFFGQAINRYAIFLGSALLVIAAVFAMNERYFTAVYLGSAGLWMCRDVILHYF